MFKKFTWNGSQSQTYTSEYGSQVILGEKASFFSTNSGADFVMDAENHQLILIPSQVGNDDTIKFSGAVNIKAGRCVLDFSDNADANVEMSPLNVGGGESLATLEIFNLDAYNLSSTHNVMKNGYLSMRISGGFASSMGDQLYLTDNAKVNISVDSDVLGMPQCSLLGDSLLEFRCDTFIGLETLFSASGTSNIWLYTNTLRDTAFDLGAGDAQIAIIRNKKSPLLGSNTFNFNTHEGKNNGRFILDFDLGGGSSGGNAFGKSYLLANKMISIDNIPQLTDKKLNFEWGSAGALYGFMVVSLK